MDKPLGGTEIADTEIAGKGSDGNRAERQVENCPLHQGFFQATVSHTTASHLWYPSAPAVSWTQLGQTSLGCHGATEPLPASSPPAWTPGPL